MRTYYAKMWAYVSLQVLDGVPHVQRTPRHTTGPLSPKSHPYGPENRRHLSLRHTPHPNHPTSHPEVKQAGRGRANPACRPPICLRGTILTPCDSSPRGGGGGRGLRTYGVLKSRVSRPGIPRRRARSTPCMLRSGRKGGTRAKHEGKGRETREIWEVVRPPPLPAEEAMPVPPHAQLILTQRTAVAPNSPVRSPNPSPNPGQCRSQIKPRHGSIRRRVQ